MQAFFCRQPRFNVTLSRDALISNKIGHILENSVSLIFSPYATFYNNINM